MTHPYDSGHYADSRWSYDPDTGEELYNGPQLLPANWRSDWDRMYSEALMENACRDIRKRSEAVREKHRLAVKNGRKLAQELQRMMWGK